MKRLLFLIALSPLILIGQDRVCFDTWQNDPEGRPNGWPRVVKLVGTNTIAPAGFTNMLRSDFETYRAARLAAYDAWERGTYASNQTVQAVISVKSEAKRIYDGDDSISRLERAFAQVLLNEINALRTNQVPPLPARTMLQLRNAIRNELDNQQ